MLTCGTIARSKHDPRTVRAWCLYDFGNSAFAVLFPSVLGLYFVDGVDGLGGDQEQWGIAVGLSMLAVAISSPIVGGIADHAGVRKRMLVAPMKPGVNLPRKFSFLVPESRTTWDEAVDRFRAVLTKLDTTRMTHRSPVLGKLSHEQWVQLHCRHAEMHFSFMHPA